MPLKTNLKPVSAAFVDAASLRLATLERQTELAKELICFRRGGTLSQIRFLAQPQSPHVARWLRLLANTQTTVEVLSANDVPPFQNDLFSVRPLLPRWLRLPMVVRYILAGLVLRFSRTENVSKLTHAHCSSGNGLMAWLSGQPYLIQVYGSEVLCAHERSAGYRWLLRQILDGAERIGGCTTEISRVLMEQFHIPREKLYEFSLSYDDANFYALEPSLRDERRREIGLPTDQPVWSICRRSHPHYHTLYVVQGFLEFCEQGGEGQLVVLCGDQQPDYMRKIRQTVHSHAHSHRIMIIEEILSLEEFAAWLQMSDFSISVPRTDNFSNAVLEAMACASIPILSSLEAYDELRPCHAIQWITKFDPEDFCAKFHETAKSWNENLGPQREECCHFAQVEYSRERAIRGIADFYLGNEKRANESEETRTSNSRAA